MRPSYRRRLAGIPCDARRATTIVALLATLLSFAASAVRAEEPRSADEHIVLHTIGGDIALALFPDAAPKTVAQILKLTRLGVFDSMQFYRADPGFVLQTSTADYRLLPASAEQKAAIQKIPAEFSAIQHARGILSMAHMDNDINSGETSFSILLGPAPYLDGQYTVFGKVERGMDVVDGLAAVPRKKNTSEPAARLTIIRAFVVSAKELAELPLAGPRPVVVPPTPEDLNAVNDNIANWSGSRRLTLSALALVVVIGLCGYLLAMRQSKKPASAAAAASPRGGFSPLLLINLLHVLISAALLFVLLTAAGRTFSRLDNEDVDELLSESTRSALTGLAGVILVALIGVTLSRAAPKMLLSLNLINVLIAGFLLFAMLTPISPGNSTLAIGLFIGAITMFKLMGQFESNQ